VRDELRRVAVPDADGARDRAWRVVSAAYEAREPTPRKRRRWPLAVAVALAALVAALASPPGRAVLDDLREVVGVERAQPALFSLPAPGRLLVSSDAGLWVAQADGSRRLLGSYREASWSPFGRFVVAARKNELAALEPDGEARWTLARPQVAFPRWTGTETDTKIAYLTGSRLHVVAGDGTDDVDAGGVPAAARVAPDWRPGPGFVLAYVDTRGRVTVYDAASGAVRFRTRPLPDVVSVDWSPHDRLLVVTAGGVEVYGAQGQRVRHVRLPGVVAAAFSPDGRRIAIVRRAEVFLVDTSRRTTRRGFAGAGPLEGLSWSADGRWLLVGWPTADQWVFVRADGRRIRAVSNVSEQFRSGSFPRVEGWCCAQ
jgi:WD40-like Beta Propeller Repeat